jgi:hypothetical protein
MVIKTDSWHYRWYVYWLKYGKTTPPLQENLCHYVRVLALWVPGAWMREWCKRHDTVIGIMYGGIMGLLILGALGTVAYEHPVKFGLGVGSFLVLLATVALTVLTVEWMRGRKPEIPGTVKLAAGYVVAKKRRICPFVTFEETLSD